MPDDSGLRWADLARGLAGGQLETTASGALIAWSLARGVRVAAPPFAPREVAREVLRGAGRAIAVDELRDGPTFDGPATFSVRFRQDFKGLPVDRSEVVVNIYRDGRLHSIYSRYHDDVPPGLDPAQARIDAVEARQVVARLTRSYRRRQIGPPRLIVYRVPGADRYLPVPPRRARRRERFLATVARHLARARATGVDAAGGAHVLAWDVRVATERPRHRWRVLVDAVDGHLVDVTDLVAYASGHGRVFDPNPIVTSGDTTLSTSSSTRVLNAQRQKVALPRLDPKDEAGYLHLDGAWVNMEDFEDPKYAEPRSKTGSFTYTWTSKKFLNVMVYFHIDRFQNYIQHDLGLPAAGDFSVPADAQGMDNVDNSQGSAQGIGLGKGPVPDASDAMLILHEYGHVIQDSTWPGSAIGNYASGVSEGFGDVLAAVYYDDKHVNPAATRGLMFSWETNAGDHAWPGRRYDRPWFFYGPEWAIGTGHDRAQHWCSTLFELYRKLGGDSANAAVKQAARDLLLRLHFMANGTAPVEDARVEEFAQQILAADTVLAWHVPDGLHTKVIYDTFARRALPGWTLPLPVDVYIDDGRDGGYGSRSGQDLFNETLWLEPFDQAPDVWTLKAQYPAGAQNAGTPNDHVPPQPGQQAFIYARVKNRGANASGSVTVRAFHGAATSDWPGNWVAADVPSIVYAGGVAAGGSIVAGPFPFMPASASPSLLVVVECAADPALTQTLPAGAAVTIGDLIHLDNNIALRHLVAAP